jgi:acetyl esterase
LSARRRLECLPDNPNAKNVATYWGDDPAAHNRCSPINYVERSCWPVFVAIAEYENRPMGGCGMNC